MRNLANADSLACGPFGTGVWTRSPLLLLAESWKQQRCLCWEQHWQQSPLQIQQLWHHHHHAWQRILEEVAWQGYALQMRRGRGHNFVVFGGFLQKGWLPYCPQQPASQLCWLLMPQKMTHHP